MVHVKDAAIAYIKALEASIEKIRGEIFNVGSNEKNYQIIEIGKKIQKNIPNSIMKISEKKVDIRNYKVNFDKIKNILNYNTKYTLNDGITEIKKVLENNKIIDFTNPKYHNYKYLTNSIC